MKSCHRVRSPGHSFPASSRRRLLWLIIHAVAWSAGRKGLQSVSDTESGVLMALKFTAGCCKQIRTMLVYF